MASARVTKRLTATAYHEAGHAAACLFAEGQPIGVKRVSIVADEGEGTLGRVLQDRPPAWLVREAEYGLSPRGVRAVENRAIVLLAGKAAEDRYTGRRATHGSAAYAIDPEHGRVIVGGDQHHAVEWLERISEGDAVETGLLWRLAEHRARRLVEVHWYFIERLAGELLSRRSLTGREVRELWPPPRSS